MIHYKLRYDDKPDLRIDVANSGPHTVMTVVQVCSFVDSVPSLEVGIGGEYISMIKTLPCGMSNWDGSKVDDLKSECWNR